MSSSSKLASPWREFLCGLQRITGDIDYYTAIPASVDLQSIAGPGSSLAHKHKIWLQRVTVNTMSEDYESRLTEIFPGQFRNLRLFAPDPYDYILSKLERNSGKDRDDADYLFKNLHLDSKILRDRYEREQRPYLANENRHDTTLKLWIEIFETAPAQ